MMDLGARICLVAGPQYFDSQGLAEDRVRWNTLQHDRRIGDMVSLEERTSPEDIEGVAASRFPGAASAALRAVVISAKFSRSPLTTIGNIWSRAQGFAVAGGRPAPICRQFELRRESTGQRAFHDGPVAVGTVQDIGFQPVTSSSRCSEGLS